MVELKLVLLMIIAFFLCGLATLRKRSYFIYITLFLFIWYILAFSRDSYDISNYRFAYDNMIVRGKEKYFDMLQLLCYNAGMSFNVFKFLWGTLMAVLLYKGIKKYTNYYAYSTMVFIITPMLGFGTQLRSSMAGAIVVYAIYYLLKDKKRDLLTFCLLILLASTMHQMAIFFLILLLPKLIPFSGMAFRNIACIVVFILSCIFWSFPDRIEAFLISITEVVSISSINSLLKRVSQFFSIALRSNIKGFLFSTCHHVLIFALTEWACLAMKRLTDDNVNCFYSSHQSEFIRKLNAMMLFIIPLYAFSVQFNRFFYYFLPVCYGVISQAIGENKVDKHNRYKGQIIELLLISCSIFVFIISIKNDPKEFMRILNGISIMW